MENRQNIVLCIQNSRHFGEVWKKRGCLVIIVEYVILKVVCLFPKCLKFSNLNTNHEAMNYEFKKTENVSCAKFCISFYHPSFQ